MVEESDLPTRPYCPTPREKCRTEDTINKMEHASGRKGRFPSTNNRNCERNGHHYVDAAASPRAASGSVCGGSVGRGLGRVHSTTTPHKSPRTLQHPFNYSR